jgi:hypothetical protein
MPINLHEKAHLRNKDVERRTMLNLRLAKWSVKNNTESNWLRTESFGGFL